MSAEDLESARRSLIAASSTLDWYDTKSQWDSVRANILEERRRIAELFLKIHVIEADTCLHSTGDGAETEDPDSDAEEVSQRVSDQATSVESVLPVFNMPRGRCGRIPVHTAHVWGEPRFWCNGLGELAAFPRLDATDTAD